MVVPPERYVQPVSPLPLPGVLRGPRIATESASAALVEACRLFIAGPPSSAALCYPLPSRAWDRAAAIFRVFGLRRLHGCGH